METLKNINAYSIIKNVTPASTSKFLLAAFVRVFAQKMTAEICPMQVFVRFTPCPSSTALEIHIP
jgi:hypothetical protein